MPLYHQFEQVRLRLLGKVRFTEDENDENKLQISLAIRLMNEAEGQVEQDLSPRYLAPLQTEAGAPFSQLPVRPTQEIIRTVCELQSCIRILETDFGRGSAADGDKYASKLRERYKEVVDSRILKKKEESYLNWYFPPLPGLRLNFNNSAADDGYSGMPMNTSDRPNSDSFPRHQINSPSETFWNVDWDDCL